MQRDDYDRLRRAFDDLGQLGASDLRTIDKENAQEARRQLAWSLRRWGTEFEGGIPDAAARLAPDGGDLGAEGDVGFVSPSADAGDGDVDSPEGVHPEVRDKYAELDRRLERIEEELGIDEERLEADARMVDRKLPNLSLLRVEAMPDRPYEEAVFAADSVNQKILDKLTEEFGGGAEVFAEEGELRVGVRR